MSNITAYPLQDWFETTLAQSWNGAVGTVYLNTAPSFTFPSGVKTYIVVNPWKTNMQVGEIDSLHVWNKTVNVSSISVGSWAGTTYTQESHSVWSTVIISDNYQFWKNIIDAVNSKIDWLVQGIYFYADATARDAALWATPSTNWLIVWLTSEWKLTYSLGGAWIDVGTGATFVNASTTAAGKVEIATTAQSSAGTDTGETGALLSVLPSDIAKNTQSSTFIYGTDVGGDDTYVVALTPTLAAYTTGQILTFKATTANTGACSVDFWPSVLNIKTADGNDPQSGVIRAGMVVSGHYDGTNFVLDTPDLASDTSKGIVELATSAETITGTSTTLAVTPAWATAAIDQALVWGDYDRQWQINWFNDSSTSFINATTSANYNLAAKQVDDCMNLDFTSDWYVYSVLRGKPWAANLNLRWDDVTRAELEFWLMIPTSIPSANRYVEVWFADTSATTWWTDFTSVQRRCFITWGNAVSTSYLMRTADGTTASSGGALTATITNWNKINIIYERWVSVKTYINDVLAETKVTNLPSWTNTMCVGAGIDSASSEDLKLSAITVRVKYA